MTGMKCGRLIVTKRAETARGHGKEAWWEARCSCGNKTIVRGSSLRKGSTRSCGCLQTEMRPTLNLRHGHAGKARSPEYVIWVGIIARCTNPNCKDFKRYGGRGIGLYGPWRKDFEVFLRAVGRKPGPGYQLDRINNNRGYVPGNVRWVLPLQQQRNRRNLRFLTFRKQTKCLSAWAESLGLSDSGLANRLKHWTKERAFTEKPRRSKHK